MVFGYCADVGCTQPLVTEIAAMGNDGIGVDSPALAVRNGLPLIAYRRSDAGLVVVACSSVDCEAGSRHPLPRVNANEPGLALALDASGKALLAHVESANGRAQVRVVEWGGQ